MEENELYGGIIEAGKEYGMMYQRRREREERYTFYAICAVAVICIIALWFSM